MPHKKRRPESSRAKPVTVKVFRRFRADITAAVEHLKHECATNLRRCAELQRDLDELRRRIRG